MPTAQGASPDIRTQPNTHISPLEAPHLSTPPLHRPFQNTPKKHPPFSHYEIAPEYQLYPPLHLPTVLQYDLSRYICIPSEGGIFPKVHHHPGYYKSAYISSDHYPKTPQKHAIPRLLAPHSRYANYFGFPMPEQSQWQPESPMMIITKSYTNSAVHITHDASSQESPHSISESSSPKNRNESDTYIHITTNRSLVANPFPLSQNTFPDAVC